MRFTRLIWDGQPAARTDRRDLRPHRVGQLLHGPADLCQMLQIGARSDMHVKPSHFQPASLGSFHAFRQLLVPNAVLRLLAARVCFLAVSVPETGIDTQRDFSIGYALAQLIDHVGRTAVDVNVVLHHQVEGHVVEDVRCIDDGRRIARRRVAGFQSSVDLAPADAIDQSAVTADQVNHGQIRAGFLSIPHHVKGGQVFHSFDDLGSVIDESGRAEFLSQFVNRYAGNLGADSRKTRGRHIHRLLKRTVLWDRTNSEATPWKKATHTS